MNPNRLCPLTASMARSADTMSNAISVGWTSSPKLMFTLSNASRILVNLVPKSSNPAWRYSCDVGGNE